MTMETPILMVNPYEKMMVMFPNFRLGILPQNMEVSQSWRIPSHGYHGTSPEIWMMMTGATSMYENPYVMYGNVCHPI